jgi:hypothetical protein
MAETFNLATPEVTPAIQTAAYQLVFLLLDFEGQTIVVRIRGEHGELREFRYGGPLPLTPATERQKAVTLMLALNKANLSLKSLQRRVLEQLVADGLIAGTISGVPD